jgi:hypothetical protein
VQVDDALIARFSRAWLLAFGHEDSRKAEDRGRSGVDGIIMVVQRREVLPPSEEIHERR